MSSIATKAGDEVVTSIRDDAGTLRALAVGPPVTSPRRSAARTPGSPTWNGVIPPTHAGFASGAVQTQLVARDLDAVARSLRERGAALVSPGAVTLPDAKLGFGRGLLVRDPDGHVMEVVQR